MWAAPFMQCCLLSARAGLKQRPVWLLLLPAQTELFKVAAGGYHPPCVQWKKRGGREEGRGQTSTGRKRMKWETEARKTKTKGAGQEEK